MLEPLHGPSATSHRASFALGTVRMRPEWSHLQNESYRTSSGRGSPSQNLSRDPWDMLGVEVSIDGIRCHIVFHYVSLCFYVSRCVVSL